MMRELIIDSFAGGGGASTGIEMALGRSPDYAINHDPDALAMHRANHPDTVHLSKNIYKVDPLDVVGRRPVGLLWSSPDCKHFSKAKGGKPVEKNIRDLATTVLLWAERARPRVIILENVEEFQDWGPLTADNRPDLERKGETFKWWVKQLRRRRYKVEWRELRACDYGAPTIRKRLFVIARRDGQPIVWPEPTHGDPKTEAVQSGALLPWRTAAEIIDWSLPCPSIFDTADEIKEKFGLRAKRPLAEATLKRIARGVMRYVVHAKRPFIVVCNHGGDGFRGQSVDDPAQTQTASRDAFGIVAPVLTHGQQGGRNRPIDAPHHTITASRKDYNAVLAPVLTGCGGRAGQSEPRPADKPMATLTAKPDHVIAAAKLVPNSPVEASEMVGGFPVAAAPCHAEETGVWPDRHDNRTGGERGPAQCVTAGETAPDFIAASLVQTGYGEREGQAPRSLDIEAPIGTQVAGAAKHAVVAGFLAQHNAGPRAGLNVKSADKPVSTVTVAAAQQGVVATHLTRQFGNSVGADPDQPAPTVTAGGSGKTGVVAAHVQTLRGSDRRDADAGVPLNTISAGGQHAALVAAFLDTYYGTEQAPALDGPMPTDTTRDRRSLVTVDIDGETFVITDIGMRMLTPRERFRAQGFPDTYIIETGIHWDGSPVSLTQEVQGRCCGNSVCPPLAQALAAANCADLAVQLEAAE